LVVLEVNEDIHKLEQKLKLTNTIIINYFKDNDLIINVDKCNVMIFNVKTKNIRISIKINNQELEMVNNYKYLGVTIDTKLNFKLNNDQLYAKLARMLNAINSKRKYINEPISFKLITSLVYSILDYAIIIYYVFLTTSQVKKLNRLFEKSLKIINPRSPQDAKSKYKILNVRERFIYFTACFVKKSMNENRDVYQNYDSLTYELRRNVMLKLFHLTSNSIQKTILFSEEKIKN